MIRKKKKEERPSEFTDAEGKKWVQTSPDDLFAVKELNEIIKSINANQTGEDIVLAHIDFKKVNREYYEALKELQDQLLKKDMMMKKLIQHTRALIDRKNSKLNELIAYIRKLHMVIAHYQSGGDTSKIAIEEPITPMHHIHDEEDEVVYEEVAEYFLDENGTEIK